MVAATIGIAGIRRAGISIVALRVGCANRIVDAFVSFAGVRRAGVSIVAITVRETIRKPSFNRLDLV